MLNQNQINKLMKKAGRKVEEKFNKIEYEQKLRQKREQQERDKYLLSIRDQIVKIENENHKRGPCVCIWRNCIYGVKNNKAVHSLLPINDVKQTFELIETIDDKQFYMLSESFYEETKKSMDWISKHYVEIKIALASIKNQTNPKERIVQMLSLGSIFEEFQKEFPNKSMFYFKECISAFDELLQNNINNLCPDCGGQYSDHTKECCSTCKGAGKITKG